MRNSNRNQSPQLPFGRPVCAGSPSSDGKSGQTVFRLLSVGGSRDEAEAQTCPARVDSLPPPVAR